ncbi:MAG: hypothetical protein ACKPCI_20545 [Dolichospermum sp.]
MLQLLIAIADCVGWIECDRRSCRVGCIVIANLILTDSVINL